MINVVGSLCFVSLALAVATADAQERWLHPLCEPLECTKNGPFVQLQDGSLLAFEKGALCKSSDGGKTWSEPGPAIHSGVNVGHGGHCGQFLQTRSGAIVVVYLDFDGYKWSWNNEIGAPNPDCKLELWAIRSVDGGKTWADRQRLLDGYNADFMGFIQTSSGELVATVEHLVPELKRWVSMSLVSEDDGATWSPSNLIDLGGHGHHDGAVEPMVVELRDGRLMMLIRTSLDEFWKAYSSDGGRNWRVIQPSGIDASSSPGWITRLESERLVLVWNRLNSESKNPFPKGNSPGPAFAQPASWQREELSIAFSEDDGATWTEPVVIARELGGQLSYAYVHERKPGELWVFTRYNYHKGGKSAPPVSVRIIESEFIADLSDK
jgi:hypothetical protein